MRPRMPLGINFGMLLALSHGNIQRKPLGMVLGMSVGTTSGIRQEPFNEYFRNAF